MVNAPLQISFALREKLQIKLERMEKKNFISSVTEPTKLVNSLAITEKLGSSKLQECIDPRDLNQADLRSHYPMETLQNIIPNVTGARYLSKLDVGFSAIKLTEKSSHSTTFNTPFGRYQYLLMPFGNFVHVKLFHQYVYGRRLRLKQTINLSSLL